MLWERSYALFLHAQWERTPAPFMPSLHCILEARGLPCMGVVSFTPQTNTQTLTTRGKALRTLHGRYIDAPWRAMDAPWRCHGCRSYGASKKAPRHFHEHTRNISIVRRVQEVYGRRKRHRHGSAMEVPWNVMDAPRTCHGRAIDAP